MYSPVVTWERALRTTPYSRDPRVELVVPLDGDRDAGFGGARRQDQAVALAGPSGVNTDTQRTAGRAMSPRISSGRYSTRVPGPPSGTSAVPTLTWGRAMGAEAVTPGRRAWTSSSQAWPRPERETSSMPVICGQVDAGPGAGEVEAQGLGPDLPQRRCWSPGSDGDPVGGGQVDGRPRAGR